MKTIAISLALVVLAAAASAESITICTADGCRPVDAGLKIPASYWKPLSAEERAMLSPPISVNGKSVKATPSAGRHYATLPPAEFDHLYQGNMTVNIVYSESEMLLSCRKPVPLMMGCARVVDNVCVIHMRDEAALRANKRTHDLVLRHEMGHCNGWPPDHRGARLPAKEATR